jgi:hypothetical protein
MVAIPISRPQMINTTLIMTTQANESMGWPQLIPLNYERQIIGLVVNIKVGGLLTIPY